MSRLPKTKCCRSVPRCRDCPALRRFERDVADGRAALVEEVLRGRPPRPVPPAVTAALATLDGARTEAPTGIEPV